MDCLRRKKMILVVSTHGAKRRVPGGVIPTYLIGEKGNQVLILTKNPPRIWPCFGFLPEIGLF